MKKLILVLLFVISNDSFAFDWDKCRERVKGTGHWLWFSITSPYGTSEFVSSTGDCKAIGLVEHDKKVFLAQNLDQIKLDSARGGGEYLDAYAHISGCDQSGKLVFPKLLQKNYEQIYGSDSQKEPKAIYESLENVIHSDPVTSKGCKFKS